MADIKEKLGGVFNKALELEQAARIQYLAHAQLVKGLYGEKIIERLNEIASDELKHEELFREMIGAYLGQEPSMGIASTHRAAEIKEILEVNLKAEKEAIDLYKEIYSEVIKNKESLQYAFVKIEHSLRHIIADEEEHAAELSLLLA